MKKIGKYLLLFMACACMAFPLMSCSDDEDEAMADQIRQEVTMSMKEVTDSSAIISCEFTPLKSVAYQVRIGDNASDTVAESMEFEFSPLASGKRYTVEAISYDANHNVVSTTDIKFMTTGIATNFPKPIPPDPRKRDTLIY